MEFRYTNAAWSGVHSPFLENEGDGKCVKTEGTRIPFLSRNVFEFSTYAWT
jgi:hypothetical protein